jgi:hypothetical protein
MDSDKRNDVIWGNQLGYIILPFHLTTHGDPLAYIRKAKKVLDRKKTSLEVIFTNKVAETIMKLFGAKVHLLFFCACMLLLELNRTKLNQLYHLLVECPCVATGCHSLYFLVGLILLLIYLYRDISPLNDEAPCFGVFQDKLHTAQYSPLYVVL